MYIKKLVNFFGKYFLFAVVLFTVLSLCSFNFGSIRRQANNEKSAYATDKYFRLSQPHKLGYSVYQVLVIDNCEYICVDYNYSRICHKGNCKFCAERRKRELK